MIIEVAEVRTAAVGDSIVFTQGDFKIEQAGFGDPDEQGFYALDNRTAAPFVILFTNGERLITHPGARVYIKRH